MSIAENIAREEAKRARKGKSKPKSLGRKDAEGQEQTITLDPIRDSIEELVASYTRMNNASDEFNDQVKAAAEKSGLLSSTVRKFVVARASDDFGERARKVQQLALVFEEIGE